MATKQEIADALRNAHAAGDTVAAQKLADAYSALPQDNYFPEGDSRNGPAAVTVGQGNPGPGVTGTAVDMIRSLPGGLAKGAAGLGGFGGDMRELISAGAGKVSGMFGGDPNATEGATRNAILTMQRFGGVPEAPTSAQLQNDISQPFGGMYEPKTTAGKYTETVASFAPNAVMPGSGVARAMRVVVPGMASEAAGQATKGSKWEPLARAGGALLGGVAQGVGEGVVHAKLHPTMTMEELGAAKSAAYKAAEQQGVVIAPQPFQKFATDLGADITRNNIVSEKLHPQTLAAIEAIQNEAALGKPLSLERADILRQEVTGAFETASSRDARLLTKVKEGLDSFLDNVSPAETLSGDASVAVPILKNARELAQREFKAKEIQKLIDLAENSASTNYSASGYEQALRAQFKNFNAKLIKDPALAKSFTNAEREAIKKVSEGGPVGNALRWLGKYSPNGSVQTGMASSLGMSTGGGLGYLLSGGNPQVAVAAGLAGQTAALGGGALARSGATLATSRNARVAAELMRAGGQASPSAASIPRNVILPLLLSQQAR